MCIPLDRATVALIREVFGPAYESEGFDVRHIDEALATFEYHGLTNEGFRHAVQDHLRAHIIQLRIAAGAEAARQERDSLDAYLREHVAPGHADDWQYGWCS